MDRKISKTEQIERLIRVSESSRSCLRDEAISLKQRFDVPARVRSSLKGHPTAWIFGSLAAGLVASWMFRRKPVATELKNRGLLLSLLGLAVTAARPLAKIWLTDQVKSYLTGRARISPVSTLSGQHSLHKPSLLEKTF